MTDQANARKVLYKNGWAVGALVASVIIIVFLAHFRDDYDPIVPLLLVGVPIGVALGAWVGLAVEGPALSLKRRNAIGLSILLGFFLYGVTPVLYLMHRT